MAEFAPNPNSNMTDRILALASHVCRSELELVPNTEFPLFVSWEGGSRREIFPNRLQLDKMYIPRNDLSVEGVTFGLRDEGMQLHALLGQEPIEDDPFTRYIYDTFMATYTTHPHEQCVKQRVEYEPPMPDNIF